jgi:hypothetical protein
MKARIGILTSGLVLSLIACQEGRGELNFTTEPTIFRGVWTAQARDNKSAQTSPLRLELTATYVDKFSYTVTGTLKFADDAALEVTGGANGSTRETYLMAAVPPSLNLSVKQASSELGNLRCYWFKEFAQKSCELSFSGGTRAGSYTVVNLVK